MPSIDWKFISEQEGSQKLVGYIPSTPGFTNQSGVTIATGFDIGQHSAPQLRNLFGSTPLFKKLSPYANLKQASARKALAQQPLNITAAEALQIDTAIKHRKTSILILKYDSAIQIKRQRFPKHNLLDFSQLPQEAATVIASVAFQYGIELSSSTPKFWEQITDQDWKAVHTNLLNFGDAYPSRRRREADYLSPLLAPTPQP